MSNERYKLEGSGPSTKKANSQLEKEKKDLVKKFKKFSSSVPTTLSVTSEYFEGEFELKSDYESELTDFHVVSKKGWDELNAKVEQLTDTPKAYTAVYTVKQYLELTSGQKEALGKKPTAGIMPHTTSGRDITSFLGM